MKLRKILLMLLVISPVLFLNCRDEIRCQPYFDKLVRRIGDEDAPDVGYVDSLRAPGYVKEGWLKPIPDQLVEKDFDPRLLAYFQRDESGRHCGESSDTCYTYALPHDFQTVALVLNVELFERIDIDPERIPDLAVAGEWTWDKFEGFAAELTSHDEGIYGAGLTSAFTNWLPFLLQAGGSLFDESGTFMTLDTDEAREAMIFYTDLVLNGFAFVPEGPWPSRGMFGQLEWPEPPAYGEGGLLDMFVDGRVAMFFAGPSQYNSLRNLYRDKRIFDPPVRVVELPAGRSGKRATVAYVVGYGLFQEPSESALAFLAFATSEDEMRIWFEPESLGLEPPMPAPPIFMPARLSLQQDWVDAYSESEADKSAAEAFLAGADYLHFYQPATLPFEALEAFDREAAEILSWALAGEIATEEAVQELQAAGNTILEEFQQVE